MSCKDKYTSSSSLLTLTIENDLHNPCIDQGREKQLSCHRVDVGHSLTIDHITTSCWYCRVAASAAVVALTSLYSLSLFASSLSSSSLSSTDYHGLHSDSLPLPTRTTVMKYWLVWCCDLLPWHHCHHACRGCLIIVIGLPIPFPFSPSLLPSFPPVTVTATDADDAAQIVLATFFWCVFYWSSSP